MKKYLILAAATLAAMCACTKNEVFTPDQEISFQVANYSPATKAGDATLDGNADFGVFAYYNTENWADVTGNKTASVYMNNVQVLHGNDDTVKDWAPVKTYYWPKTGKLSFVGYAPYIATSTTSGALQASYTVADGVKFNNFAITTTPGDGNKDYNLLYSGLVTDQSGNTTGEVHTGVPIIFNHALAKLNFNLKFDASKLTDANKDEFTIVVNKIEIKVNNAGNFTQIPAQNANNWAITSTSKTTVSYAQTSSTLAATESTDKSKVVMQKDYLADYFVIPDEPCDVTVYYKVNGLPAALDLVATGTLKGAKNATDNTYEIPYWNMNTIYTYTILISPVGDEPILFDPSVAAWNTVGPTDVPVK